MWRILDIFKKKVVEEKPKDNRLYPARCGHETKIVEQIEVNGELHQIELLLKDGHPNYCIECLKEMIIRCTWCGEPIFPDEPITLDSAKDKTWEPPEYAVAYQDGKHQCFVGCLRWNCAESGADRAGFWVAPGVVERVKSPLELSVETGSIVVVNDISDPNEIPTLLGTPKFED